MPLPPPSLEEREILRQIVRAKSYETGVYEVGQEIIQSPWSNGVVATNSKLPVVAQEAFTEIQSSSGFNKPIDVALDLEGNMYVINAGASYNYKIQKIDKSGNSSFIIPDTTDLQTFVDPFLRRLTFLDPMSIDVDSEGSIFISDMDQRVVSKIDKNNRASIRPFLPVVGIAIAPNGIIYMGQNRGPFEIINEIVSTYTTSFPAPINCHSRPSVVIPGHDRESRESWIPAFARMPCFTHPPAAAPPRSPRPRCESRTDAGAQTPALPARSARVVWPCR